MLNNHEVDDEEKANEEKNVLYFTNESLGILESFTLFITIKTITKLNLIKRYFL